ncbi:hypothetical protein HAX54_022891, partial [Datura stramonium]|nr:hypothetical protein [Datura stramonium]
NVSSKEKTEVKKKAWSGGEEKKGRERRRYSAGDFWFGSCRLGEEKRRRDRVRVEKRKRRRAGVVRGLGATVLRPQWPEKMRRDERERGGWWYGDERRRRRLLQQLWCFAGKNEGGKRKMSGKERRSGGGSLEGEGGNNEK